MTNRYTFYPTLEEALYLHKQLIEKFGGSQGVRDLGLLESSLSRPRSGYYQTIYEQAAALLQSLAQNHVFVDGNKRIAFALTAVFLRLNGYRLSVSADHGERFLIEKVIKKKVELGEIAKWLKKYIQKR